MTEADARDRLLALGFEPGESRGARAVGVRGLDLLLLRVGVHKLGLPAMRQIPQHAEITAVVGG